MVGPNKKDQLLDKNTKNTMSCLSSRGGKIGPIRWASPIRSELGLGLTIKLLVRKKSGQIWPDPIWPSPVWFGPLEFFFCLGKTILPDQPDF